MRTVQPLPPEITTLLFNLGKRRLIIVEGPDDLEVFHEWYVDHLSRIRFHPAGGRDAVQALMEDIAATGLGVNVYAIVDRDFCPDSEVDSALADSGTRVFILRRYAVENYLLEPASVAEELRVFYGARQTAPDEASMRVELLSLCARLRTLVAANWVFRDVGGVAYFPEGHDILAREEMIRLSQKRLPLAPDEARERIEQKEDVVDSFLHSLDTAHCVINGKHILYHLVKAHDARIRPSIQREVLLRQLARRIRETDGIHPDIVEIVDNRILS